MDTSSNKLIMSLFKFCIAYYIFILVLYEFGPWNWTTNNSLYFYALHCLYLAFFSMGYLKRERTGRGNEQRMKWDNKQDRRLMYILGRLLILAVIIQAVTLLRNYGLNGLNFSDLLNQMIRNMSNIGEGYRSYQELKQIDKTGLIGGAWFTGIRIVWNFLEYNVLLLTIWYFPRLRTIYKVFGGILLAEVCLFFVSIGTNIGIFRVIFAAALFSLLKKSRKVYEQNRAIRWFSLDKQKILALVGIFAILYFFVSSQEARYGGDMTRRIFVQGLSGGEVIGLNHDSIFFTFCLNFCISH